MKTSTRFLLAMTVWTVGGCEWIAGIEDTTVARDAGQDARVDDTRDGGVPMDDCPGPGCIGDAVAEFATNHDGPWRYMADLILFGFREMLYDATRDPPAWHGEEQDPPSIVACNQHTDFPGCSGLEDRLLLQPGALSEFRPVLAWTAPETGTYRLIIDWRLDDTQPDEVPVEVLVSRNNQYDRVLTAAVAASTAVDTFPQGNSVEIDAVQGDSLGLVLAGDTRTALGVRFYVSDLARNDHCQMAFLFEGSSPFPNACKDGEQFTDAGDDATVAVTHPAFPGQAQRFSADSLLRYQGAINDYDGDWTLQFWATLQGAGEVLSDLSCRDDGDGIVSGGISVTFDGDVLTISASDETLRSDCTTPPHEVSIRGDEEFDPGIWHFYRIVRTRDENKVDVCVNGQRVGTMTIPSASPMATDRPLEIGNRVDTTQEGSFLGHIADLRLYDRALPCLPSP